MTEPYTFTPDEKIRTRYLLALLETGDIARAFVRVSDDLLKEAAELGWSPDIIDKIPSTVLAVIAPYIAESAEAASFKVN